ncbi:MAG: RNA polymerase sigma factor [Planctomycetes bacterium]|nr:RNA polymerase sigma factor [Planctomycetota bacterium]
MTADARDPLLEPLSRGDPEAFAAFYDRHGSGLFAVARALLSSRADAEDAVQETFLSLFRSRAAFARAQSPRAYAFAALRRAAHRLRSRRTALPLPAEPSVEDADLPPEPDPALARALGRLAVEQREVLALKLHGGLTFSEIAASLGIPSNTAASRYRYALEHLQRELGGPA